MKDVEQGRVWGRYNLEVGSRVVDRLFLSGELVQQIELRVILESLLSKNVVDRAFRELKNRDSSWNLWSGAAGAASFCRRRPADCQWSSDDLHSEL